MKGDAVILLVVGTGIFAMGRSEGRLEDAGRLRTARTAQRVAEGSADSLARFIAHRKCWFDPVPRTFWKGAAHP